MIRQPSLRRIAIACLALVWFVAGCGQSSSGSGSAASPSVSALPASTPAGADSKASSQADATTRTFSTVKGDIQIPANPKRIVTQGLLSYFLLFDVKPVGAPSWELEYKHLAGKTEGIEDIGATNDVSIEKILSLQPDLIVVASDNQYDQLSQIAPTVVIPYDQIGDAHKDTRLFGKLLGQEDKAEQWLAGFDKKVADSKSKLDKTVKPDETFTIVSAFNKKFYIYGDGIYRGGQAIYKYLQLKPPAIVKEHLMDAGKMLLDVSLEVIPQYAGDHIFLDVSNGAKFDENAGVWKSIDAVKNNRVHKLNVDIFWPYDPLAIEMQLDEVLKLLGAEAP